MGQTVIPGEKKCVRAFNTLEADHNLWSISSQPRDAGYLYVAAKAIKGAAALIRKGLGVLFLVSNNPIKIIVCP